MTYRRRRPIDCRSQYSVLSLLCSPLVCPHHAGIGLGRPPRRRCKERHLHPRPMTTTVFTTEMLAATDILYTQPRLGSMRQRHSTKG
ncbi:hypothetical protein OH76DRAFT_1145049 [Lentinus brumalis]|uniref:Uncharacterized protein n=1 Tax=Lentinus brumalis TaxID=2498619 RepID=A0A371DMH7_9APHY|nr:hypothetical protein OH76DRAFT_1145049 [Polyporus brumalis]